MDHRSDFPLWRRGLMPTNRQRPAKADADQQQQGMASPMDQNCQPDRYQKQHLNAKANLFGSSKHMKQQQQQNPQPDMKPPSMPLLKQDPLQTPLAKHQPPPTRPQEELPPQPVHRGMGMRSRTPQDNAESQESPKPQAETPQSQTQPHNRADYMRHGLYRQNREQAEVRPAPKPQTQPQADDTSRMSQPRFEPEPERPQSAQGQQQQPHQEEQSSRQQNPQGVPIQGSVPEFKPQKLRKNEKSEKQKRRQQKRVNRKKPLGQQEQSSPEEV